MKDGVAILSLECQHPYPGTLLSPAVLALTVLVIERLEHTGYDRRFDHRRSTPLW